MTHAVVPSDISEAHQSRLARFMTQVTLAGIVFAVAGTLWVWTDRALVETLLAPQFGLAGRAVSVTPMVQLAGLALSAPPLALLIYMLLQARAVFRGFAVGMRFTDLVATRVSRIGLILVAKGLLAPLWRAAAGVVLTLGNPPGQKILVIAISSDDVLWAIVGALLVAIGWTLREAARIAEEHASFV
ncbi:DUF2975 domain-containing protein [Phreatobacter aquaticus]|uniref:DUF2975 domain-containing protein n=1 Tax=Phreatobacter aquaticus TaxID=2570229 RepID=A0A4D7QLN1_9HYPH|nr:DUF2975 domain-containing protein [Phreatobacter aquaticus]QCK88095.1 DUF2975 domain-containing protein [Phreatobacter aquaticus]